MFTDDRLTLVSLSAIGYSFENRGSWKGIANIASKYGFEMSHQGEITAKFHKTDIATQGQNILMLLSEVILWEEERRALSEESISPSNHQAGVIMKTFHIGGHEVPEPLSEAPNVGDTFFGVRMNEMCLHYKDTWRGDSQQLYQLSNRTLHLTASAAGAHALALIQANRVAVIGFD